MRVDELGRPLNNEMNSALDRAEYWEKAFREEREENERLKKEWNDMRDENDEAGRRAGKDALWKARARKLLEEVWLDMTISDPKGKKIRAFLDGEETCES